MDKKHYQYLTAKKFFMTSNIVEGSLNDYGRMLSILRNYSENFGYFPTILALFPNLIFALKGIQNANNTEQKQHGTVNSQQRC